jgi:PAS domain-containing protein
MFHNLLRIFHDGILMADGVNIVFANPAFENIFGIEKSYVENRDS